jgi:hypothetical protein
MRPVRGELNLSASDEFGPAAVPEASTLALLIASGAGGTVRRLRRGATELRRRGTLRTGDGTAGVLRRSIAPASPTPRAPRRRSRVANLSESQDHRRQYAQRAGDRADRQALA